MCLLGLILDACASDSVVLRPLVMVFGALLAALHVRRGGEGAALAWAYLRHTHALPPARPPRRCAWGRA